MMADGGFHMLAAYYPSPPGHQSPGQYSCPPPASDPRCIEPPLTTLPLPYDNARADLGVSATLPHNIKSEFGGVGTAFAYGGPPRPAMSITESNTGLLNDLGFTKPSAEKKLTRDGQPAKRRGPKPDSKPAMTRRQELNRQAQRTHRERKEQYIKELEDQVLRLREIFTKISQDKQCLAAENQSLKILLHQNGLAMPTPVGMMDDSMSNASGGPYLGSSSISNSNSYGLPSTTTQHSPYTPPALSATSAVPQGLSPPGLSPGHQASISPRRPSSIGQMPASQRNANIDYEQNGINFVLHLEQPCMNHLPWLLERSVANGGHEPSGHALMASCPPQPFPALTSDVPFGHNHTTNAAEANARPPTSRNFSRQHNAALSPDPPVTVSRTGPGHPAPPVVRVDGAATLPTWELSKADLNTLLDLSQKLDLDGLEVTPVQAWGMVLAHPRLGELKEADFRELAEVLKSKISCYGFGAALESFEVRDALEAVLSTKPEMIHTTGGA